MQEDLKKKMPKEHTR